MRRDRKVRIAVYDVTAIALFSALISVCSLIQVPLGPVPFTLQTFAVFLCIYILGIFKSAAAVAIYIILGLIGVPVFAGFRSGPAAIFGPTGGFLIGFILSCFLSGFLLRRTGGKAVIDILSLSAGLVLIYVCGTLWFLFVYSGSRPEGGLIGALSLTVFPFIIPDTVKIIISVIVGKRLKTIGYKIIKKQGIK